MHSISSNIKDLTDSVPIESSFSENWSKLIQNDSDSNLNININNDISLISNKDYYKNKYLNLEIKYNNLINQYVKLKKNIIEIYNIITSINSYKITPSVKEPINKIKKILSQNVEIMKIFKNFKNLNNDAKKISDNENKNIISDEKYIRIFFSSVDNKIHFSLLCKDTDIFEKIKNLLYDKYPNYREAKNIFMLNGINIQNNKSIKENKIKDGDKIVLYNDIILKKNKLK